MDKAVKVIQTWWRFTKIVLKEKLNKIIKIQSAFRGRLVCRRLNQILYIHFLYINFCEKIEKVLRNRVFPNILDKLKFYACNNIFKDNNKNILIESKTNPNQKIAVKKYIKN